MTKPPKFKEAAALDFIDKVERGEVRSRAAMPPVGRQDDGGG